MQLWVSDAKAGGGAKRQSWESIQVCQPAKRNPINILSINQVD